MLLVFESEQDNCPSIVHVCVLLICRLVLKANVASYSTRQYQSPEQSKSMALHQVGSVLLYYKLSEVA